MAPRSAAANQAVREHTAETILSAAAKTFARRGYAGTKVADIAEAAGVSSGLVHHYFATKADVFSTLIEQVMSAATQVPSDALDREGTPLANVRWMVEQMLLGATYAPEYYVLTLHVQMSEAVPEASRELVMKRGDDAQALMAEVVARAQHAGDVREGDPSALMAHVLAAIQGLAIQLAFSDERPAGVPDIDVILGMLMPCTDEGGAS